MNSIAHPASVSLEEDATLLLIVTLLFLGFSVPVADSILRTFRSHSYDLSFHSEDVLHIPVSHFGETVQSELLSLFMLALCRLSQVYSFAEYKALAENGIEVWDYFRLIYSFSELNGGLSSLRKYHDIGVII